MSPAADPGGRDGPPLALTMGDPAGIGGEIALKAWAAGAESGGVPPFFVIDDPDRLAALAAALGLAVPVHAIDKPAAAQARFASALPVLPLCLATEARPGHPDTANAGAVRESIDTAVRLAMAGEAGAVVTNPIHKKTLYAADFPDPGHTEYLARLAGIQTPPVMMLASETLRVVPVTVHEPLARAVAALSTGAIVETGRIVAGALAEDFAIAEPRLAVAGLNPHAGEEGALGSEEAEIIQPAIEALRKAGITADGPVAPDALFTPGRIGTFDAALCMYHDQALIPIKALAFESAVNVTLGLPFVRTSPDHGTAFDIAGSGRASETSLVAALKLADAMAGRRQRRRAA